VALDPEHRLVLSVLLGRRTADHSQLLVEDFHRRMGGRLMDLLTSDENPAYGAAIPEVYGQTAQPRRWGPCGRLPKPYKVPPKGLVYATVHKTREGNHVVDVETRLLYGSQAGLKRALKGSAVSATVQTAFVERQNCTDRHRNARKARKTYCFSMDWDVHEAVTYFTTYSANFCWSVRKLRQEVGPKRYRQRTPAMAAVLTDHSWTLKEWLSYPAVQQR
jgi:hypothetical protein